MMPATPLASICMTNDFDVVDAGWSLERLRDSLLLIDATWLVVTDIDGARKRVHYVFHRNDVRARLEERAGGILRDALLLSSTPVALAVDQDAPAEQLSLPRVVFDAHGPVGVIPPARATRGLGSSTRAALQQRATSRPTEDELTAAVTRYLVAELPSAVEVGMEFPLLVALHSTAPGGLASATMTLAHAAAIDIVIKPLNGLTVLSQLDGTLRVAEPQDDTPIHFKLRADVAGQGVLKVYAFCGGVSVAALTLVTSVLPARSDNLGTGTRRTADAAYRRTNALLDATPRVQPDLSLFVFENGNELSFRLSSADGRHHMSAFEPVRLRTSPRDYFLNFFSDIERLPVDSVAQRQLASERLQAKGAGLFEQLFPAALKAILWTQRDRIKSMQVTSDEPWVPWEACQLTGESHDQLIDGPFFAEAFNVTRWLPGVSLASSIRMSNIAVVAPDDSNLPHAHPEKEYLKSLMTRARKVTEVRPEYFQVRANLARGVYDAWHFTGHAAASESSDANLATIQLSNGESLKPEDIVGQVANGLKPRPLVFLNACQSARSGLSLTGAGGWAQRLLNHRSPDRSASAFVGSYWAVYDEAAHDFAKAFYSALLEGSCIGEAGLLARRAIRRHGDPTWLAYTIYADPFAKLEVAEGVQI